MKPSVSWVIVFFLAEAAERKLAHSCVFAVVRQVLDDRKAWTAIGTGDKEVFVTGVFWVAQFCEAFVADGNVRWNN